MAVPRRTWIIGGLVTLVVVLAVVLAIVLVTDDDDGDDETATAGATTETTAEPADGDSSGGAAGTSETTGAADTSTSTTAGPNVSFVCPEGGMDAVVALQEEVDAGHQPWRLSAEDVASQCATGSTGAEVEAAGSNTYRVTDGATGEVFLVEVTQPVRQGSGGIWAVTSVTPAD